MHIGRDHRPALIRALHAQTVAMATQQILEFLFFVVVSYGIPINNITIIIHMVETRTYALTNRTKRKRQQQSRSSTSLVIFVCTFDLFGLIWGPCMLLLEQLSQF